jgi:hypothetical protein
MAENEAIEILENIYEKYVKDCDSEEDYMKQNFAVTEAIKVLTEIQQYRAIGTVEECREARERQSEKKPNKRQVGTNILMNKIYYCPICNKKLYDCAIKNGKLDYVSPGSKKRKFCEDCGQKLDWSE